MIVARSSLREAFAFALVNLILYSVLCLAASRSNSFHLRVLAESVAAAYLVVLTIWGWFGAQQLLTRLLLVASAMTIVFWGSRTAIQGTFASWFEVVIWYVPVVSLFCGAMLLSGLRVQPSSQPDQRTTFSIRTMMLATALIAIMFPLIGAFIQSRTEGRLPMQWLLDNLVLVVPLSVISVGLVIATLRRNVPLTVVLLIAAPLCGVGVCRIYGWNHYQTIVVQSTTIAMMTFVFSLIARYKGCRMVSETPVPNVVA